MREQTGCGDMTQKCKKVGACITNFGFLFIVIEFEANEGHLEGP